MSGIPFEVFGKIDDIDGLEGTLLDADTATDAELLGYPRNLGRRRHVDAELAHAHYRTKLVAPSVLGLG